MSPQKALSQEKEVDTLFIVGIDGELQQVLPTNSFDSISFGSDTSVLFWKSGEVLRKDLRTDIDSISFVRPKISKTPETKSISLSGYVSDHNGDFLKGVLVRSGSKKVYTNLIGYFELDTVEVVNNRIILNLSKDGYFPLQRSERYRSSTSMSMSLQPKGNVHGYSAHETFTATEAKQVKIGDSMSLSLPTNALVTANGEPYLGEANVDVMFLHPNYPDFSEKMPGGDMSAIASDGSSKQLVSFGIATVLLSDSTGKKLQLGNGVSATMSAIIPDNLLTDAPDTMPMWHWDEEMSIWVEEGFAEREGNYYIAEVSHFSTWNWDYGVLGGTTKGRVVDCNGNGVADVKVVPVSMDDLSGGSSRACSYASSAMSYYGTYTDKDGYYSFDILRSRDAAGNWYCTPVYSVILGGMQVGDFGRAKSITGANLSYSDITFSCPIEVSGSFTNTCDSLSTAFWLEKDGKIVPNSAAIVENKGSFTMRSYQSGDLELWALSDTGAVKIKDINVASGGTVSVGEISLCYNEDFVQDTTINANGVSFKMKGVKGGVFEMGCTEEHQDICSNLKDSQKHTVSLSGFNISETEVTQELWLSVMDSFPKKIISLDSVMREDTMGVNVVEEVAVSEEFGLGDNYPVYNIGWNDIVGTSDAEVGYTINGVTYYKNGFCYKLSETAGGSMQFRLPTEAEWEYAARGGSAAASQTIYSGSNNIDDVAWYVNNSGNKTHEVKGKTANALGVYDMSGNIPEWCSDWYGNYSADFQVNPTGLVTGWAHIIRGGGCQSENMYNRVIYREQDYYYGYGGVGLGIRLAVSIKK
jgi:formylglycine-generating enzyme required for sulfatase activity